MMHRQVKADAVEGLSDTEESFCLPTNSSGSTNDSRNISAPTRSLQGCDSMISSNADPARLIESFEKAEARLTKFAHLCTIKDELERNLRTCQHCGFEQSLASLSLTSTSLSIPDSTRGIPQAVLDYRSASLPQEGRVPATVPAAAMSSGNSSGNSSGPTSQADSSYDSNSSTPYEVSSSYTSTGAVMTGEGQEGSRESTLTKNDATAASRTSPPVLSGPDDLDRPTREQSSVEALYAASLTTIEELKRELSMIERRVKIAERKEKEFEKGNKKLKDEKKKLEEDRNYDRVERDATIGKMTEELETYKIQVGLFEADFKTAMKKKEKMKMAFGEQIESLKGHWEAEKAEVRSLKEKLSRMSSTS